MGRERLRRSLGHSACTWNRGPSEIQSHNAIRKQTSVAGEFLMPPQPVVIGFFRLMHPPFTCSKASLDDWRLPSPGAEKALVRVATQGKSGGGIPGSIPSTVK